MYNWNWHCCKKSNYLTLQPIKDPNENISLGSGELGKEFTIAKRIGQIVIAVDELVKSTSNASGTWFWGDQYAGWRGFR
jgi:hypothetical protein